jgi:hypothetical protein
MSPYLGNVDEYYSDDVMSSARHCYQVRLNADPTRRRIIVNLSEIPRPGVSPSPN